MTAMVIRYIGFLLYNCMEKTVYRVWKTWEIREFYFAKFVSTLVWFNDSCVAYISEVTVITDIDDSSAEVNSAWPYSMGSALSTGDDQHEQRSS